MPTAGTPASPPSPGGRFTIRRSIVIVRLFLVIGCALALPATADVIYGNFTAVGTGASFVGGPDVPTPPFAPTQQAMPFPVVAPANYAGFVLTAVEVPLVWEGYGPNEVRVSVYDDAGGHPGKELDHAVVSGTELVATVVSAAMAGGVAVPSGVTCWVVLYGVGAAEFGWAVGSPVTYSGVGLYRDPVAGTPWMSPMGDVDLAFRVFGDPVDAVADEVAPWGAVKALFR